MLTESYTLTQPGYVDCKHYQAHTLVTSKRNTIKSPFLGCGRVTLSNRSHRLTPDRVRRMYVNCMSEWASRCFV